MPVRHRKLRMLRQTGLIAAHRRSDFSDRILATILAAIAGCANAVDSVWQLYFTHDRLSVAACGSGRVAKSGELQ